VTIWLPTIHSPKFLLWICTQITCQINIKSSTLNVWTLLIKYQAINGLPGGVTYFFDDQDVLVADKNLKLTLIRWLPFHFYILFAWRSLQAQWCSNLSERVCKKFQPIKPCTGPWVQFLPLPGPVTRPQSSSQRFRFELEFGVKLQQH
jgi:hypothetical protein